MAILSPQEKAALVIWVLMNQANLNANVVKFYSDIAAVKLSEEEKVNLQKMVASILFGQSVNQDENSPFLGHLDNSIMQHTTPESGPGNSSIQPNLGDMGFGHGITTGESPQSVAQNQNKIIKQAQNLSVLENSLRTIVDFFPQLQSLEELGRNMNLEELAQIMPTIQGILDNLPELQSILGQQMASKEEGGRKMAQDNSFKQVIAALEKEAIKADLKGDGVLSEKIKNTLVYTQYLSKKAQAAQLSTEIVKAELKGDQEVVANLEEKLAEIRDGIRYLDRDWDAFSKFDVFPEQVEEVVTMGYAKPEYNMGEEHIVNPMNVLEPSGKIPDMEQFPSGNDPRVKDFKDAKPGVPMAEDGKGNSSISKVVEEIETVKVLDEVEDVHQKPQTSVPDNLPKIASVEKEAQLQVMLRSLPAIIAALPALIENADQIQELLNSFDVDINLTSILPVLTQLSELLPQLTAAQNALVASKKKYVIKIAGKYEKIDADNIVFEATEEDPDGHFPVNTRARAVNALARVNQYSKVPAWAKKRGIKSLKALVNRVVRKVQQKAKENGWDINISEASKIPKLQQK